MEHLPCSIYQELLSALAYVVIMKIPQLCVTVLSASPSRAVESQPHGLYKALQATKDGAKLEPRLCLLYQVCCCLSSPAGLDRGRRWQDPTRGPLHPQPLPTSSTAPLQAGPLAQARLSSGKGSDSGTHQPAFDSRLRC